MDPVKLLVEATKRAPALMFAWFILGLVAVIAIINKLQMSYVVALVGVCVLMMLIIVARIILIDPKTATALEKGIQGTLQVFTVACFIGTVITVACALVFNRPDLFNRTPPPKPTIPVEAESEPSTQATPEAKPPEGAAPFEPKVDILIKPVGKLPLGIKYEPPSEAAAVESPPPPPPLKPLSPAEDFFNKIKGDWRMVDVKRLNSSENPSDTSCVRNNRETRSLHIRNINAATGEIEGTLVDRVEQQMTYSPPDPSNLTNDQKICSESAARMPKIDETHYKSIDSSESDIYIVFNGSQPSAYLRYQRCERDGFTTSCPAGPPPDYRFREGTVQLVANSTLQVGNSFTYQKQ